MQTIICRVLLAERCRRTCSVACVLRVRRLYLLHYGVPKYIYQGLVKAQEGWGGTLTARRRERPLLETVSYFELCDSVLQVWLYGTVVDGWLRHSTVAVVGLGSAARGHLSGERHASPNVPTSKALIIHEIV